LRWPEFFLGETGLRMREPEYVYRRLTLCERVGEATKTGSLKFTKRMQKLSRT
jgi:hypothetical protein